MDIICSSYTECTVDSVLPTNSKQLATFPTKGLGFEPQTSQVGGQCVITAPPWPPKYKQTFSQKKYTNKLSQVFRELSNG